MSPGGGGGISADFLLRRNSVDFVNFRRSMLHGLQDVRTMATPSSRSAGNGVGSVLVRNESSWGEQRGWGGEGLIASHCWLAPSSNVLELEHLQSSPSASGLSRLTAPAAWQPSPSEHR